MVDKHTSHQDVRPSRIISSSSIITSQHEGSLRTRINTQFDENKEIYAEADEFEDKKKNKQQDQEENPNENQNGNGNGNGNDDEEEDSYNESEDFHEHYAMLKRESMCTPQQPPNMTHSFSADPRNQKVPDKIRKLHPSHQSVNLPIGINKTRNRR